MGENEIMKIEGKEIKIDEELKKDVEQAAKDAKMEYKTFEKIKKYVKQLEKTHKRFRKKVEEEGYSPDLLSAEKERIINMKKKIRKLLSKISREEHEEHDFVKRTRKLLKKSDKLINKE